MPRDTSCGERRALFSSCVQLIIIGLPRQRNRSTIRVLRVDITVSLPFMTDASPSDPSSSQTTLRLCDHGAGSSALVFPCWLQDTNSLVVSAETVNSRLDQNKSELGVLVLSVSLQVLSDGDSLAGHVSTVSPYSTIAAVLPS